jgi:hypothetical protein
MEKLDGHASSVDGGAMWRRWRQESSMRRGSAAVGRIHGYCGSVMKRHVTAGYVSPQRKQGAGNGQSMAMGGGKAMGEDRLAGI